MDPWDCCFFPRSFFLFTSSAYNAISKNFAALYTINGHEVYGCFSGSNSFCNDHFANSFKMDHRDEKQCRWNSVYFELGISESKMVFKLSPR